MVKPKPVTVASIAELAQLVKSMETEKDQLLKEIKERDESIANLKRQLDKGLAQCERLENKCERLRQEKHEEAITRDNVQWQRLERDLATAQANRDRYLGLLDKIALAFGVEAYTNSFGTVVQTVIYEKLPVLVDQTVKAQTADVVKTLLERVKGKGNV